MKSYLDEDHGGKVVFGGTIHFLNFLIFFTIYLGEVDIENKYISPTIVVDPKIESKLM